MKPKQIGETAMRPSVGRTRRANRPAKRSGRSLRPPVGNQLVLAAKIFSLPLLPGLPLFFLLDFPHPTLDEVSRRLRRLIGGLGPLRTLLYGQGVDVGTQAFGTGLASGSIFGGHGPSPTIG